MAGKLSFHFGERVNVIDPDLDCLEVVPATYRRFDEKAGTHMVVLDGEPAAERRIWPGDIGKRPVAIR